jgi:hypothetical protein
MTVFQSTGDENGIAEGKKISVFFWESQAWRTSRGLMNLDHRGTETKNVTPAATMRKKIRFVGVKLRGHLPWGPKRNEALFEQRGVRTG